MTIRSDHAYLYHGNPYTIEQRTVGGTSPDRPKKIIKVHVIRDVPGYRFVLYSAALHERQQCIRGHISWNESVPECVAAYVHWRVAAPLRKSVDPRLRNRQSFANIYIRIPIRIFQSIKELSYIDKRERMRIQRDMECIKSSRRHEHPRFETNVLALFHIHTSHTLFAKNRITAFSYKFAYSSQRRDLALPSRPPCEHTVAV